MILLTKLVTLRWAAWLEAENDAQQPGMAGQSKASCRCRWSDKEVLRHQTKRPETRRLVRLVLSCSERNGNSGEHSCRDSRPLPSASSLPQLLHPGRPSSAQPVLTPGCVYGREKHDLVNTVLQQEERCMHSEPQAKKILRPIAT